jgi:hypothetical protein
VSYWDRSLLATERIRFGPISGSMSKSLQGFEVVVVSVLKSVDIVPLESVIYNHGL